MLYRTLASLAAATTTGGAFSSAAFTGDDDGAYERLRQERARIDDEHAASAYSASSKHFTASGNSGPDGFTTSGNTDRDRQRYQDLTRPTIDTYTAMTDEELVTLLRTRESQVTQLRQVYQNFHYEADKHYRKMVLDYHDKSLQFSQVHGRMQNASIQINREALVKMREEQEMMTRDMRLTVISCLIFIFGFWAWVRRHYVGRRELEAQIEADGYDASLRSTMAHSITGSGSFNDNFFGSTKRSARSWETAWEREIRERREAAAEHGNLAGAEEKQAAIAAQLLAGKQQGGGGGGKDEEVGKSKAA